MRQLGRRSYASPGEYHAKLSEAATCFGNAACALAQLEAVRAASRIRSSRAPHRTLEVSPTGDGSLDYAKIQAAIDLAAPGDRILLKSGAFRASGAVFVWKDVSIEGEPGAAIEGTLHHNGRVVADPAQNGGFLLVSGCSAEIRNITFRNLYFAAASHSGFAALVFEDNACEDVYQSVYLSCAAGDPGSPGGPARPGVRGSPVSPSGSRPSLCARCNRISYSSLSPHSSRCRLNFYDESHLFGFYCGGPMDALIEGNRLEVAELTNRQPFHAVGAVCSGGCSAVVRDNLFKGWHSAIAVHDSEAPIICGNEINGMCEDAEFRPIGMLVRNCGGATVVSNRISNRGLGAGAIGIALSGSGRGRVLDNHLSLARDAGAGILVYRASGAVVGQNSVSGSMHCSIGIYGDQSEDATGNLLFGNSLEGKAEIKMCYASDNTIIGNRPGRADDGGNSLLGYRAEETGASPPRLGELDYGRHQRMLDHAGRKQWPEVPAGYSRSYE